MSNTKKFSYKNIAAKLPAAPITAVTLNGDVFDGAVVHVKNRLKLSELNNLITETVNTIVDMKTGEYNPEYAELVKYILLLKHYADIPVGKNDLANAYRVIYNTDLLSQVMPHVDSTQVQNALEAIDARVAFIRETIISTAGHKVVEMLGQMERVLGAVEGMSANVDSDQVQQLIAAVSELTGAMNMPVDLAGVVDEEPTPIMLGA